MVFGDVGTNSEVHCWLRLRIRRKEMRGGSGLEAGTVDLLKSLARRGVRRDEATGNQRETKVIA
jgi:hypothetical protein